MWQAVRSRKPPMPNSVIYSSKNGFRAGQIDGFRVLSRRVSDGTWLTFCSVRVAHLLIESEDCGKFVCASNVDPKIELNDDDTCVICLELLGKPTQVTRARCGHFFHRECWKKVWRHDIKSCALCRNSTDSSLFNSKAPEEADEDDWSLLKLNGWHRYNFTARVTRSSKAK